MQSLCHDLKVEVFKYTTSPISLVATNRDWRAISQDPYTRADWLIYKYGISHALFHAVRLGRSFLTVEVVQALLSKKAVCSRYFIQRLFKNFGTHDEKLMKFKEQRDLNQINRIIRKETWGSSLHMEVFKILLIKGFSIFHNCEIKGNDMELFHLLSAGPLDVNYAPQILRQNIDSIEDLILKYKFIPFPKRPKAVYEDTVEYAELMQARTNEEHSLRYGYENNFQLDVVAGAILIHPDLISLWNKIGYYEICNDVNEIVMRGALLILFPLNPPNNWERPDVNTIVTRLKQLIKLGFHLTYNVLEEIFHLFEHRLNEIGDLLMNSIKEIFVESKSVIAESCLIWAIKPERNHEKTDLLKFLIDRIDQPEKALKNALDHYKVGFRFDFKSIKTTNEIRSLTVNSNLYYWILKSYGPSSEITQQCFDDIVESRTWIDLKLQGTSGSDGPIRLTTCAFNSICSIYLEFCNDKVPFKPCYLQYLQLVNNNEIIEPFFEMSLPITFGLQLKGTFPFDITYDYKRPKVDVQNHKRQFNVMNDNQQTTKERKNWYDLLKKYEEQILGNNFELTERFKNNFEKFWPLFIDYDQMNDGDDFVVEGTSSKRLKQ